MAALLVLTLVGATPTDPQAMVLAEGAGDMLAAWYGSVLPRRERESFGELAVRAGMAQLGRAYFDPPQSDGPESFEAHLDTFQCLSFVESTLALARCIWRGQPDTACFLAEVAASHYRNGIVGDYAARLHYFNDWVSDNASRGRVVNLTAELGGAPRRESFSLMTSHVASFPPLAKPDLFQAIQAVEVRLSNTPQVVLDRQTVSSAQARLADGDVLAFVGSRPGVLITHVGFVAREPDGIPRVLHASSYHKRVLLTRNSVADYVTRRAERSGLMVVRPLPPDAQDATRAQLKGDSAR